MNWLDPWGLKGQESGEDTRGATFDHFPTKWETRTPFTTFVSVFIFRPNSGYGDEFNSLRITRTYSDVAGLQFYYDMVGANAANEDFAKKHQGMTLPDGVYHYTTRLLTANDDGTFSSGNFANVYRMETNDENIPEEMRDKINSDYSLAHANKKTGDVGEYSSTPFSAGCTIVQGQEAQDRFMEVLKLASSPEDIWVTITSGDKE